VNGFEGAGQLTTFIRLKGCNLRCAYCDTQYSQEAEPENWMTIDEVIEQIHFPKVTITGGEPLLQKEAVEELCNRLVYHLNNEHYAKVSIETNGSIVPTYFHADVKYIVDFKLKSSGVKGMMDLLVFSALRHCDVVKFVISDIDDYRYARILTSSHPNFSAPKKVFSPAVKVIEETWPWGCRPKPPRVDTSWPRQLAEMMIRDKVDAQFSLQIHKVLWPGAKEER
jgi:7-carboxy-7-deazaguanine synthase